MQALDLADWERETPQMVQSSSSRFRGTARSAAGVVSKWLRGLTTSLRRLNLALEGGGAQEMRFHMIDSSHLVSLQRNETKLLAHGPFLDLLRGQVRECAIAWLSDKSDDIGQRSTVDLKQCFA
jgi:hypothetical protein